MAHFWLTISILLVSGVAGGIRNYCLINSADRNFAAFVRVILEGVAAALIVPLFLSAIGNDITNTIITGDKDWLYAVIKLMGFSVLAALYSRHFLDNVSGRLLKIEADLDEEKKQSRKIEEVVGETSERVNQIAPLVIEESVASQDVSVSAVSLDALSTEQQNVLRAFAAGFVPARSIEGLSLSTELDEGDLRTILDGLCDLGLLQRIETKRGPRWALTTKGRALPRR